MLTKEDYQNIVNVLKMTPTQGLESAAILINIVGKITAEFLTDVPEIKEPVKEPKETK